MLCRIAIDDAGFTVAGGVRVETAEPGIFERVAQETRKLAGQPLSQAEFDRALWVAAEAGARWAPMDRLDVLADVAVFQTVLRGGHFSHLDGWAYGREVLTALVPLLDRHPTEGVLLIAREPLAFAIEQATLTLDIEGAERAGDETAAGRLRLQQRRLQQAKASLFT